VVIAGGNRLAWGIGCALAAISAVLFGLAESMYPFGRWDEVAYLSLRDTAFCTTRDVAAMTVLPAGACLSFVIAAIAIRRQSGVGQSWGWVFALAASWSLADVVGRLVAGSSLISSRPTPGWGAAFLLAVLLGGIAAFSLHRGAARA
jgi:hypothetical protein